MTLSGVPGELGLRLTRQLGDRVWLGGLIYPLLLLAVALRTTIPRDHPVLYASGLLLTLAGALWSTRAAYKARTATADLWLGLREELRVATLALATLWALLSGFGLYAYPEGDFPIFLLFAVLPWLSIGAFAFSPDLHLAQIFIHLHILPAMIWSYQVRDRFGISLLFLFALLWVALYLLIERSSAQLRQFLLARIQLESQTEELRQSRDRAQESSRLRTRFLANISHQIRTPLNGIVGVNELLRESPLDSQQTELVSIINQSAQRLHSLVNDLLDLSQVSDGTLQLAPVDFDIRLLIEDLSRPLRLAAETKGLQWTVRIRREVPASCFGDPTRVKQVLHNLMSNALKFTDQGGVTIEVGMADGGHLRCLVEDSGIGIPSSHLNLIFDELNHTGATPSSGGAGLSLAVSRKLIEMMGGRLGVQSAPGQGSRFWFEIPVSPSTSETRS
jgi:signal transduction histidine kinase